MRTILWISRAFLYPIDENVQIFAFLINLIIPNALTEILKSIPYSRKPIQKSESTIMQKSNFLY